MHGDPTGGGGRGVVLEAFGQPATASAGDRHIPSGAPGSAESDQHASGQCKELGRCVLRMLYAPPNMSAHGPWSVETRPVRYSSVIVYANRRAVSASLMPATKSADGQ